MEENKEEEELKPEQVEAYKEIKKLARENREVWDKLMNWIVKVHNLREQSESRELFENHRRIKTEALDNLDYFLFGVPVEIEEKEDNPDSI